MPTISIIRSPNAARLLLDALGVVQNAITDYALTIEDDATRALALLDRLADEIAGSVRVVGSVHVESSTAATRARTRSVQTQATVSSTPTLNLDMTRGESEEIQSGEVVQRSGVEQHRVHFGALSNLLAQLVDALPVRRVWILIDEWSSVPLDLQPLLADLLRRSVFPVTGTTVKIGAIEQRSNFRVALPGGDHLGIEVGADAAADVDLDEFMVFGNNADRAKEFFRLLLHKHVSAVMAAEQEDEEVPSTADLLVQRVFTRRNALTSLFARQKECRVMQSTYWRLRHSEPTTM